MVSCSTYTYTVRRPVTSLSCKIKSFKYKRSAHTFCSDLSASNNFELRKKWTSNQGTLNQVKDILLYTLIKTYIVSPIFRKAPVCKYLQHIYMDVWNSFVRLCKEMFISKVRLGVICCIFCLDLGNVWENGHYMPVMSIVITLVSLGWRKAFVVVSWAGGVIHQGQEKALPHCVPGSLDQRKRINQYESRPPGAGEGTSSECPR